PILEIGSINVDPEGRGRTTEPHFPPGSQTASASGQNRELTYLSSAFGPDAKLVPCQFNQDSSAAMDGSSSKSVSDAPGVGVECGARTGLLALIFGTEEAGRRFLSSNPVLQKTLVIRVQNCIAIWRK